MAHRMRRSTSPPRPQPQRTMPDLRRTRGDRRRHRAGWGPADPARDAGDHHGQGCARHRSGGSAPSRQAEGAGRSAPPAGAADRSGSPTRSTRSPRPSRRRRTSPRRRPPRARGGTGESQAGADDTAPALRPPLAARWCPPERRGSARPDRTRRARGRASRRSPSRRRESRPHDRPAREDAPRTPEPTGPDRTHGAACSRRRSCGSAHFSK